MKSMLHILYKTCQVLSEVSLVIIAALVLIQILLRQFGIVFVEAELSIYALAALSFLALAHTFNAGGHIRVTLFIDRFGPKMKKTCELLALIAAIFIIAYFTWYFSEMTYKSFLFNKKSLGNVIIPLWIPQSIVVIGLAVFLISMVQSLVLILGGKRPAYQESTAELQDSAPG